RNRAGRKSREEQADQRPLCGHANHRPSTDEEARSGRLSDGQSQRGGDTSIDKDADPSYDDCCAFAKVQSGIQEHSARIGRNFKWRGYLRDK
ncbi:unnamed protein product, partial [Ectocarpus sp. 4 AP-2014]